MTRTATNAYFPQISAVISLPSAEDVLSALVRGHFSEAQSPPDISQARRLNSVLRAPLAGTPTRTFPFGPNSCGGHDHDAALPPKLGASDVFASGEPTIAENLSGCLPYAQTLDRGYGIRTPAGSKAISNLVVVHRLREVSRLTASPASRLRRPPRMATAKISASQCMERR
jgi:hypothetical protein